MGEKGGGVFSGRSLLRHFGALPSGAQRDVILRSFSHGFDHLDQIFHISGVFDEINFRSVDHQQRGKLVVKEKIVISLGKLFQIFPGNGFFKVDVSFF